MATSDNHPHFAFKRNEDKSSYTYNNIQGLKFGKNNGVYSWYTPYKRSNLPLATPQQYFCKDTATGDKKYIMSAEHFSYPDFVIPYNDMNETELWYQKSDGRVTNVFCTNSRKSPNRNTAFITGGGIYFNLANEDGDVVDWNKIRCDLQLEFPTDDSYYNFTDSKLQGCILTGIDFNVKNAHYAEGLEDLWMDVLWQGYDMPNTKIIINNNEMTVLQQTLNGLDGNIGEINLGFDISSESVQFVDIIDKSSATAEIYGTTSISVTTYF